VAAPARAAVSGDSSVQCPAGDLRSVREGCPCAQGCWGCKHTAVSWPPGLLQRSPCKPQLGCCPQEAVVPPDGILACRRAGTSPCHAWLGNVMGNLCLPAPVLGLSACRSSGSLLQERLPLPWKSPVLGRHMAHGCGCPSFLFLQIIKSSLHSLWLLLHAGALRLQPLSPPQIFLER